MNTETIIMLCIMGASIAEGIKDDWVWKESKGYRAANEMWHWWKFPMWGLVYMAIAVAAGDWWLFVGLTTLRMLIFGSTYNISRDRAPWIMGGYEIIGQNLKKYELPIWVGLIIFNLLFWSVKTGLWDL